MANIARVEVTETWKKLEEEIEGFTPEVDSQYQLQNTGAGEILVYEGSTAPTGIDGFVVPLYKGAKLTKKADEYWFVRTVTGKSTINLGTL